METPNGATFEGQFNKGLPNGLGVMKFPDGSKYEGEFMQGWFHGHGMFIAGDGSKFEGAIWCFLVHYTLNLCILTFKIGRKFRAI